MLKLDKNQEKIWNKLENLSQEINLNNNFFSKIFGVKKYRNFYLYSAPGRGKTMLLKKFYEKIEVKKSYFHFNDFMIQIHQNLHQIRLSQKAYKDELIQALKIVLKDAKLLCFDEFQVEDITNAMILGRVFSYIFSQKITVVITTNSKPCELYKNGLQRELFLEFVNKILLKNVEVINFDDNIDYRLQYQQNLHKRYFVENDKNKEIFNEIISNSTKNEELKPLILKVFGRDLKIKKTYKKIAIIDFNDFSKQNLAMADFKAICKEFNLIFLKNLPIFGQDMINEAKRFMIFIDEIYENKTALIILAQEKIEKLYEDKKIEKYSKRVISRLNEIKSDFYFNNSKLFL